ncbi:unnamed protein product [Phytophthora lilii]|uniref:Unnamed protein product n=1 Tax=Phytophthora lilii TaxID=2077276 RepID=A0A9W6U7H4_9STRA|nr:unnamed protein product [Phytophthora lilii]
MMDQIRSKLERAQRRLARNASGSSTASSSSVSSGYIPASEYSSAMHKPPVKSVLVEDMPATASKSYRSTAPPPSMRPPPSTRHGVPPPPSSMRHHGMPPPSSRRPPPSSRYDLGARHSRYPESGRYAQQQYKSRSKYAQEDADPLNGGPPPMSTPYLVYSSSRPPMTGSQHIKSSRVPLSKAPPTEHREKRPDEDKHRHRVPPSSNYNTAIHAPPSAMRSGLARPPSSRVRFEDHESEMRESIEKLERDSEEERKRRQQQLKEREARHQRHREQEIKNINARAKGSGPSSPIAAATRGRRSSSVENPPSSAIKLSAYEDIAQAMPTSPVARPRRSSINNPPPKSDIKVSAFDDIIPRRRSSGAQDNPPKALEPAQPDEEIVNKATDTPEIVELPKAAAADTDADQDQSSESDNQETAELVSPLSPPAVHSPPQSVVQDTVELSSSEEEESGDTSGFETDDSYEFSDFDTDSDLGYISSGYSVFNSSARPEANVVVEEKPDSDKSEDAVQANETNVGNQDPEADDVPSPPASELSTVKEEEEEEPQPASRLTARDLAFLALGRASSCSLSDLGSPIPSANGKGSPKNAPPMSYTPASSAFLPSRALGRPPVPATTGRNRYSRMPPPAPSTSVASYIRRSRARAPMDLKNQLPPSIGVLSGLSSGSSTFVMDPNYFYEVTWKSGEFAFSVQRVYTEENEYEFDDRNQEPQLFLRMLLNTERSTCKSFRDVRVGDVLIRVGDAYVSELGLEGSGTVLTKFFAKMTAQTPVKLTFQRMTFSDWEGGVEL